MTGFPVRYLGWMARDAAAGPGLVMAVVAVLAALVIGNLQVVGPGPGGLGGPLLFILDWTTTVLTLLATAGLVSGDFAQGYQRTLFAKPVSPPLYYFQRWLVGGVGVMLGAVLMGVAVGRRVETPLGGLRFLAQVALLYLLLGGLVFLLSTLTRRDWLFAALLVAAQTALHTARSVGFGDGPVAATLYGLLPPFHLVGLGGSPPGGAELVWAVVYGAALLLAALAVLRWRPLARGARQ